MSCRKERIEIPIGSDFKLIVQLTRIDGTAIPPDSVAWELRFASREKLYANYIVKSSELGDRWHEVEGSDKILIPIPSDHSMAPGELCCKIRYSTPDAQFSDDSYDAESTWRIVELGGDGGYSLTLVSASRAGHSKFPEDMEFAVVLPQGERGEAGKTAYESAVEHGYTGTEDGFYQALGNTNFAKEWADDVLKETTENFPSSSRKIDYHLEKEREAINKKSYPPIPFEAPMADRVQAIDRIEGEIEKAYRELGMDYIIDTDLYINKARASAIEVAGWGTSLVDSYNNTKVIYLPDFICNDQKVEEDTLSYCAFLIQIKKLTISSKTKLTSFGMQNYALEIIEELDFPNITSTQAIFAYCKKLRKINKITFPDNVERHELLFYGCSSLESLPAINFKGAGEVNSSFFIGEMPKLTHFGGFVDIGFSFDMSGFPLLTVESLVNTLNGLAIISAGRDTLTLGAINRAKLTDVEIAIGIMKGWIISG